MLRLVFSLIFLLVSPLSGFCDSTTERGLQEGWIWPVLVLPPDEGWDSPEGKTVTSVLSYAQSQVNDSVDGIRGRDVLFEPGKPGEPLPSAKYRAVISFASSGVNKPLVASWTPGYPPFVLADDAMTEIRSRSGDLLEGVFSLQLHRSFLSRAAVERAGSILPPASEAAIFSDMVDLYLSRSARATSQGLSSKGFDSQIFWVAGGARDSYDMIVQEMFGYGADMLMLWMDEMSTREIYRQIRKINGTVPVWSSAGAVPGVAVLDGVYTADQDEPVVSDPELRRLKTDVWDSTRVRVPDTLLASKAYAVCRWVIGAMEASDDDASIPLVTRAMASAKGVPLGGQSLEISPVTHRPAHRMVSVVRADKGNWIPEDRFLLSESGPGYFFDTPAELR